MSNLEFLKYLEENGILDILPVLGENPDHATVWDSDGWRYLIIWFDKEGNVIENLCMYRDEK